jgi:hypothetical protein
MMRKLFVIITLFVSVQSWAQKDKVIGNMKRFHELIVEKRFYFDQYIHKDLSYGHSNGWVEKADEFANNLRNNIITYHSFKEDSVTAEVDKKIAHIRFIADIDVTLRGVRSTHKLRVIEVWVRRGNSWLLFARQAVRYI